MSGPLLGHAHGVRETAVPHGAPREARPEKARGIDVWHQPSEVQKMLLVNEVVRMENVTLEHPLPSYGSIFFWSRLSARDGLQRSTRLLPLGLPCTGPFGVTNDKL